MKRVSKKTRDFQRKRVYDAEEILKDRSRRFETVEEIEAYTKKITRSRWFKKRWPRLKRLDIWNGRANSRGLGSYRGLGWGVLRLPRWCRWESYILHELAHVVTGTQYKFVPFHGREFCKNYLALIGRWMGKEAAKDLRQSFREHRVKWVLRK